MFTEMGPCKKCKTTAGYREAGALVGGVHAVLCQPCRTAWGGHTLAHPLFAAFRLIEARITALRAQLGQPGVTYELGNFLAESLSKALQEYDALTLRFREEVALPWLAEVPCASEELSPGRADRRPLSWKENPDAEWGTMVGGDPLAGG